MIRMRMMSCCQAHVRVPRRLLSQPESGTVRHDEVLDWERSESYCAQANILCLRKSIIYNKAWGTVNHPLFQGSHLYYCPESCSPHALYRGLYLRSTPNSTGCTASAILCTPPETIKDALEPPSWCREFRILANAGGWNRSLNQIAIFVSTKSTFSQNWA